MTKPDASADVAGRALGGSGRVSDVLGSGPHPGGIPAAADRLRASSPEALFQAVAQITADRFAGRDGAVAALDIEAAVDRGP